METLKTLYAIPNFECNLSCGYCDLKDKRVIYNEEKFLEALNSFQGSVVLFGGEPLLFKDRLYRILVTGKINSISTNLLMLDEKIAKYLKGINIATTWTPERFNNNSLNTWRKKLKLLTRNKIKTKLLITLSDDTLETDPYKVFDFLKTLEEYSINTVLFEQLLDYTKDREYYNKADSWLCEMHEYFKMLSFINEIEEQIKNGWYFDCSEVYTLYPNGEIKKFCPQFSSYSLNTDCLKCERNTTCRPCMLQNKCVYPQKFGNLVLEEYIKGTSK